MLDRNSTKQEAAKGRGQEVEKRMGKGGDGDGSIEESVNKKTESGKYVHAPMQSVPFRASVHRVRATVQGVALHCMVGVASISERVLVHFNKIKEDMIYDKVTAYKIA